LKNLTDKIIQLANDSTLQKKLGQCGSHFVRENFAVEKMVGGIYDLYMKLAAERGFRV
jgi:glycosyltransferase involved in cell wall biosynthesis